MYISVCVCVCVCTRAATSTGNANVYTKHKYDNHFCNFVSFRSNFCPRDYKLHCAISALKVFKINKLLLENKQSNFVTIVTFPLTKRISHLLSASRLAFRSYGLIRPIEKVLIPDVSKEYAAFVFKDHGVLPELRDP